LASSTIRADGRSEEDELLMFN